MPAPTKALRSWPDGSHLSLYRPGIRATILSLHHMRAAGIRKTLLCLRRPITAAVQRKMHAFGLGQNSQRSLYATCYEVASKEKLRHVFPADAMGTSTQDTVPRVIRHRNRKIFQEPLGGGPIT